MKQLAKKINTKLVTNDNTRKDYFKTPLYFSWWRSGKQQETKGNHPSDNQFGWTSLKAKGTDIVKFGFRTKKCKIRIGKDRIDGVELSTLDQILQNDNNKTNDEETNQ